MAPPRTPSQWKAKGSKAAAADPPNGQIRGGVWHCNCSPPLPAVQFTVRRETKNKGRSFYSCQKKNDRGNKCDFFLWSEDARLREVGAVLSNARSEASGGGPSAGKKQTTLHTAITPRAERRDGTERTPISRVVDLGFGGAGGGAGGSSSKAAGSVSLPTTASTTPSARSSTLKASSSSNNLSPPPPPPPPEDLDSDLSTDAEDELVRLTDATSVTATPAPPTATAPSTEPATGSKRKREREDDDDDDEYSDFSSGEEEQLAAIVDRSGKKREAAFTTPAVGAARTQNVIDLTGGIPTPLTGKPVRRVLFSAGTTPAAAAVDSPSTEATAAATPSSGSGSGSGSTKRQRVNEGGDFLPSPSPTAAAAAATPGGSTAGDITQEIMGLLRRGQAKLEEPVLRDVRAALERHAAKARGLERGRDASRLAAKKAEARAAELQERVADLENRRRMDAENRRKTRGKLLELYGDS